LSIQALRPQQALVQTLLGLRNDGTQYLHIGRTNETKDQRSAGYTANNSFTRGIVGPTQHAFPGYGNPFIVHHHLITISGQPMLGPTTIRTIATSGAVRRRQAAKPRRKCRISVVRRRRLGDSDRQHICNDDCWPLRNSANHRYGCDDHGIAPKPFTPSAIAEGVRELKFQMRYSSECLPAGGTSAAVKTAEGRHIPLAALSQITTPSEEWQRARFLGKADNG
jgi:hypothetical protein